MSIAPQIQDRVAPPTDKYDEAIEYLTEHPEEIRETWLMPGARPSGCLFQIAARNYSGPGRKAVGCITMIRHQTLMGYVAETPELTEQILSDNRIPKTPNGITVAHLPVFAEWQRRLDRELLNKA